MEHRLVTAAMTLSVASLGCPSPATMTRVTATGGAFALYAGSPQGLQEAARQALDQIKQRCAGSYEITALEKVPQPEQSGTAYYLELNGDAAFGPFRTQIEFDCRKPQSLALNQLLEGVATRRPESTRSCQSDRDCTGIATLCYEGVCRR
jgi:hypothetical protein